MARPKNFNEQEVLEKAVSLFWCRGYEATSVQDLVTGLGINRFSLYDTFGDKHQLFLRALGEYGQQAQFSRCALFRQPRPAAELVRELLESTVRETLADEKACGCFMVNSTAELAPHDPEVAQLVAANQQHFEQELAAVLARGQSEGTISADHSPHALARFLFNTVSGLKVLGKSYAPAETLHEVVAVAWSALAPAEKRSN